MTHAKEGYSVPAKSHASPADGEAALSDHDSHRLAELCPRCRHRGQAIAAGPDPGRGSRPTGGAASADEIGARCD